VASPSRTLVVRALSVLALTGAAVVVPAGTGNAVPAPSTCEATRSQFAANGTAAEKVAEQLNDAKVARARTQKELVAADTKAKAAVATYGRAAADFKRIVASQLKSAPASQFSMMFTSGSPKDFAEQMALLDYVAGRRGKQIDRLDSVRAASVKAQAEATAKLVARTKYEQVMTARAADLKKRASTLTGLLSRLCVQDQPATLAARASRETGRVDLGPVGGGAQKAVQVALAQIGDPYVWAAGGPDAFDCSGLTSYAWAAAGVSLPHSSAGQMGYGTPVSRSEVRAGDLLFFYSPVHHVGIAISNTQMVHASTYGVPVGIASIDSSPFTAARRLG
jgi:cell wall-associated NlpC family hydrolase